MKIVAGGILLAAALMARAQDNFADTVVSYVPGSTYDSSYQNPNVTLGAPTASAAINNPAFGTSQICIINPGGELTLGFDTPIVNNPDNAYGMDFTIFGNDFFINGSGGIGGTSNHPGLTVWVSQNDVNFYELDVPNGYGADDSFPTEGSGNPLLPVNPALTLSSFTGLTDAQALSLYNGSAGGASFSISWAVDASGNPVDLSSINEIEIVPTTGYGLVDAVARVEAVPEPSAWALLLAGAAGVLCFRLKKPKLQRVKIQRPLILLLAWLAMGSVKAATLTENFTNDPAQDCWQVYGDTNLFQWTNDVMEVTWDSSQTNSYFYHSLGRTLSRNDNFTIAFDLEWNVANGSGYSFEMALGLLNYAEATNSDFQRGLGYSPDLVEFDYFPGTAETLGPTIWPTFVGSADDFNYNGTNDYQPYQPNLNDWYHIVMTYTASNQTMVTTMTNFEQTTGITVVDPISPGFSDFAVDTFSISSYQDDGMGDSIYAQGEVSNIVVTLPQCGNPEVVSSGSVTLTENFTNDPAQDCWQVYGDTNLFQWTNDVMEVTWDSSQTNSYFYHPLGTTLTRNDTFTLAFDLEWNVANGSGYSFETALGLLNYAEATNSDFQRGLGYSPDLVEFDYFPGTAETLGPTIWPTFVGSADDFSYNGTNDYQLYQPNLNDWYHIVMTYTASNQTMVTTMTNFEQTTGITVVDPISPGFSDFAVDTFSINSYQDDGMGDSIYAQGEVSNIVLTLPPVARNFSGGLTNGVWQGQCGTYQNWSYMLERSTNLVSWNCISPCVAGSGNVLTLNDSNAPATQAFYRVKASQP